VQVNEQDARIVDLLKEHPNKGLKLLLSNYGDRLMWAIRAKVIQSADSEDVFQNVLLKVIKGIHAFKGESALYTWLHRIAFNESMNHLAKQKRTVQNQSYQTNNVNTIQQHYDGDAIVALLARAIEELPDRQKQVFIMRYYEDMRYDEISEALNLTVGSLKATYHLAVKKIEAYVTKNEN
jgi:RNA polymerase sigma-70 factor (ECF subfamily)